MRNIGKKTFLCDFLNFKTIFFVFSTELEGLVINNKAQINLLTLLAEDYQKVAPLIVKTIEEAIFQVRVFQDLCKPIMKFDKTIKGIVIIFSNYYLNSLFL